MGNEKPPSVEKIGEIIKACDFCKKTPEKLFNCTRCRQVCYCDAACQKSAWAVHKISSSKISGFNHPLPSWNEEVCHFMRGDGKVVKLTQREFFNKTGAYFTSRNLKVVKAQIENIPQSPSKSSVPQLFCQ